MGLMRERCYILRQTIYFDRIEAMLEDGSIDYGAARAYAEAVKQKRYGYLDSILTYKPQARSRTNRSLFAGQ